MLGVLATVLLDAMGIGLVMPILPDLLRAVGGGEDPGWHFGSFLALYALAQFLFAPVLGALSDRFGRRPVLVVSLAGAAVDYLFMAFAPSLGLLFVGRAISGMTAASMAVASAYVTDITPEERRARHFGQLGAAVGVGFIAGPALGGVLGAHGLRLPFLAAAILNAANLLFVLFVLTESRQRTKEHAPLTLNPLAPLRWAFDVPALVPLLAAYAVIALVGQIGASCWVLYAEDRFAWSPVMVGLSMTGFGLFHALAQALLAGTMSERWGERTTLLVAMLSDGIASVVIALTARGWVAFLLLPLFCVGGLGATALQSLVSRAVDDEHQGRIQGVMASLAGLVAGLSPLPLSVLYFATRRTMPGFVWLFGVALYVVCVPIVLRSRAAAKVTSPAA